MLVCEKYLTPRPIESAFRHCGIWPFNPDISTDTDFGPSQAFSIQIGAPVSYPGAMPSSLFSAAPTDPDDMDWESSVLEAVDIEGTARLIDLIQPRDRRTI